ncbi:MAG: hypothetical protein ACREVK_01090 [Gammaproteobacteria bacterium]
MNNRPLPPFGKRLRERVSSGWRPRNGSILIAAGPRAWDWARRWDAEFLQRPFLCLPPSDDPVSFDWSIVAGFDAVVFIFGEIAEGIPHRLAVLLVAAGVPLVVACYDDPEIAPPSGIVSYRQPRRATA